MIRKTSFIIALILCCFFLVSPGNSAVLSSAKIAYVDIESVFNEYSETREAKKRISEELILMIKSHPGTLVLIMLSRDC